MTEILDFLACQFQARKAYRTIAGYRSALSSTLPPMDGVAVGKHPLVSRLLKGIYHARPPRPRYAATWDVGQVLEVLRGWPPANDLSIQRLTWKLAMLLALAGARRSGELRNLSASDCRILADRAEIGMLVLTKTQRTGTSLRRFTFDRFGDARLCPVAFLEEYLRRSAGWRKEEDPQLLRSVRRPHQAVSSSTVARWLVSVLDVAGIDTSTYKAHSTRGAASSAATRAGCCLEAVLESADWRQASTFRQFYWRQLATAPSAGRLFGQAVLGGQ